MMCRKVTLPFPSKHKLAACAQTLGPYVLHYLLAPGSPIPTCRLPVWQWQPQMPSGGAVAVPAAAVGPPAAWRPLRQYAAPRLSSPP